MKENLHLYTTVSRKRAKTNKRKGGTNRGDHGLVASAAQSGFTDCGFPHVLGSHYQASHMSWKIAVQDSSHGECRENGRKWKMSCKMSWKFLCCTAVLGGPQIV